MSYHLFNDLEIKAYRVYGEYLKPQEGIWDDFKATFRTKTGDVYYDPYKEQYLVL